MKLRNVLDYFWGRLALVVLCALDIIWSVLVFIFRVGDPDIFLWANFIVWFGPLIIIVVGYVLVAYIMDLYDWIKAGKH